MVKVFYVRHGQSVWNQEQGEARAAGQSEAAVRKRLSRVIKTLRERSQEQAATACASGRPGKKEVGYVY